MADAPHVAAVLRIAAVPETPWVCVDGNALAGIEIDALRQYCEWRGCGATIEMHAGSALPLLFETDAIDLAVGGIVETPRLAFAARLLMFSRHPLGIDTAAGPRARHVWAISKTAGSEILRLRMFLHARRRRLP